MPEYAVDIVFAYKAGSDPTFAPYAVANMTGSNRLLLGLGWPTIAILAWLFGGQRVLRLDHGSALPLIFLSAATLYSFSLPLRGGDLAPRQRHPDPALRRLRLPRRAPGDRTSRT